MFTERKVYNRIVLLTFLRYDVCRPLSAVRALSSNTKAAMGEDEQQDRQVHFLVDGSIHDRGDSLAPSRLASGVRPPASQNGGRRRVLILSRSYQNDLNMQAAFLVGSCD